MAKTTGFNPKDPGPYKEKGPVYPITKEMYDGRT